MTTAAEILTHALALPPRERAELAQSLLHSLPDGPAVYSTEGDLAAELNRRMSAIEAVAMPTFSADGTICRAREALHRVGVME
jgi:putative addiction module component (TIGR02574 family)